MRNLRTLLFGPRKVECSQLPYPPEKSLVTRNGETYVDMALRNKWLRDLRAVLSLAAPSFGYSKCGSCGLPWWCVAGHTVYFKPGNGLFAVCELCWRDLGPRACLPFYLDWAKAYEPESEDAIRDAVLGRSK